MQATTSQNANYWHSFPSDCVQNRFPFSMSPYFTEVVDVSCFEHCVEFISSVKNPPPPETPKRLADDIQKFSKNSRTRLLKFFSEINVSHYHRIYFTTLTYHEDFPLDHKTLKVTLDNFFKSIKRHFPESTWMWRLEFQQRGAPHFHLLFFVEKNSQLCNSNTFSKMIKEAWFNHKSCRCEHCRRYAVDVVELDTFKKGMNYVSKYSAKEDPRSKPRSSGRLWGYSNNIVRKKIHSRSISLADFVLLKKYLWEHYYEDKFKRTYLDKIASEYTSTFLFVDPNAVLLYLNIIKDLSSEEKFQQLSEMKLLPDRYYFD